MKNFKVFGLVNKNRKLKILIEIIINKKVNKVLMNKMKIINHKKVIKLIG